MRRLHVKVTITYTHTKSPVLDRHLGNIPLVSEKFVDDTFAVDSQSLDQIYYLLVLLR